MYVSGWTENGANDNNRTKKHIWRQNADCVGGATCWSSNWPYNTCKCAIILSIVLTSVDLPRCQCCFCRMMSYFMHPGRGEWIFAFILVFQDAVLPNLEWWEELFEFCTTFITWKFNYLKPKVSYLFQLMHITEGTNKLFDFMIISCNASISDVFKP